MGNCEDNNEMLDNCVFVKTVLMLIVVAYHSMVFWGGAWFSAQSVILESKLLKNIAIWLNSFHIYGFVFVSGYLFEYLKQERNRYQQLVPFILNKCKRLLIPYVFVAFAWVIPITNVLDPYTSEEIFTKFILCTSPSQLWFLWMLFDVFIIVWLIYKWIKNDLAAILISVISWGIGLVGGGVFPNIFCIWTAFTYIPYFILGMKIREKNNCFLYKTPKLIWVIFQIVLFVSGQSISLKEGFIFKVLTLALEYSAHVFGALMAFFLLQWIATKVSWKDSKLFMTISKQSMPIYLFHQQIIYFTIIWLNGKVNPYLNVMINFIVALVLSFLLSCILSSFKWTRILIGEKK